MRHRHPSPQLVPYRCFHESGGWKKFDGNWKGGGTGRVDGKDALTTPEGTVLPFARFAGETEAIVCGFERILVLESRR